MQPCRHPIYFLHDDMHFVVGCNRLEGHIPEDHHVHWADGIVTLKPREPEEVIDGSRTDGAPT